MESVSKKELQNMNTLHLPVNVEHFAVLDNKDSLEDFVSFADKNDLKILVLGDGSNVVLGDLDGRLVLKNEMEGVQIETEDDASVMVRVGGGEDWDSFVKWSVGEGYSGIEKLSLIPGTVGAAPVQNIGAYGAEVCEVIELVITYDLEKREFITISNKECNFSYRDSIFKKNLDRYIICEIVFCLSKKPAKAPEYRALQEKLSEKGIENQSTEDIRNAVIEVRQSKLPDWKKVWNAGSFFGNPRVSREKKDELLEKYPDMPTFPAGDLYKVPAGWLIENAGLKGFKKGNFRTYEKHALVLVHDGDGDYEELVIFRNEIIKKVYDLFGITLVQEPLEICRKN
jgi:UDP-N-acetylmuramate dehydrogenase